MKDPSSSPKADQRALLSCSTLLYRYVRTPSCYPSSSLRAAVALLPSLRTPILLYTMSESFSKADVAAHSKPDSLWIIVDEDVYDLTKFQDEHPGGKKSASRHRPVPISPPS